MKRLIQIVIILGAALALSACITGEQARKLEPGMTQSQVAKILENQTGFRNEVHTQSTNIPSAYFWMVVGPR